MPNIGQVGERNYLDGAEPSVGNFGLLWEEVPL
jgi:hypothetical protein